MKTICQLCKKEFYVPPSTLKRGSGKFCSMECYKKHLRRGFNTTLKCLFCGRIFSKSPSRIKIGRGKFCSKKCYHDYSIKEFTCLNCGKKYLNYKSQAGDKFCSNKCYYERFGKSFEKKCIICGNKFKTTPKRISQARGKYCSKKCSNVGNIKPMEHKHNRQLEYTKKYRNENHDWYIATKQNRRALKAKFGGVFTKDDWYKLKKKFNFTCPDCKKQEPEIKLTVDHIIPLVKWILWEKHNKPKYKWNDIENIQPLCGKCNSSKWSKIVNKDIV